MKKSIIIILIFISSITSILMVGLFIYNFHSTKFSTDIADWGQFGDYLSPVITLINTIILSLITLLIQDIQSDSEKTRSIEHERKEKYEQRDRLFSEVTKMFGELRKNLLMAKTEKDLTFEILSLSQFINSYSVEYSELQLSNEFVSVLKCVRDYSKFLNSNQSSDENIKIDYLTKYIEHEFTITSTFRKKMIKERYLQ
ncbi:MAG: hypothetical protein HXY50_07140 [Ignavibacteriaceae bacterium]|nr:hypothetical protein [Ignavibacteriaceae bacterium]